MAPTTVKSGDTDIYAPTTVSGDTKMQSSASSSACASSTAASSSDSCSASSSGQPLSRVREEIEEEEADSDDCLERKEVHYETDGHLLEQEPDHDVDDEVEEELDPQRDGDQVTGNEYGNEYDRDGYGESENVDEMMVEGPGSVRMEQNHQNLRNLQNVRNEEDQRDGGSVQNGRRTPHDAVRGVYGDRKGHRGVPTWQSPPVSMRRLNGKEQYMALQWQQSGHFGDGIDGMDGGDGIDGGDPEQSSSSDEESNLASSVDYERERRQQRTHTRLAAWRLSNPEAMDAIQQMRLHSNASSRHSIGSQKSNASRSRSRHSRGGMERKRRSMSRKSQSMSARSQGSGHVLCNRVPQQWPMPALGR